MARSHLVEPVHFSQNPCRITRFIGTFDVASADIKAQTAFHRAGFANAVFQHFGAHTQIGHRVKGRKAAAKTVVLIAVNVGHDLHQTLGAHLALGKGVETRFNGHDCQNQIGVEVRATAGFPSFCDEGADGLWGHFVFAAQPAGHGCLGFGEVFGVGRGGPCTGFHLARQA